ncbi:MAG: ABC transporter ATP-binding protein [Opitutae bacterium]|jgi:lipoprotein-releasing system ATP-binding protein|nr:ABC transporter ATP-binding protein [Opitutae bacterium]
MNSPLLQVRNLTHSFLEGDEKVHALRGVSFEANKGEVTSIIGPSGCGKSTLMYLLGLLEQPETGDILINNKSISRLSDLQRTRIRNERIGFIFQFHFLIKELSARENVALPAIKKGDNPREALKRADQILNQLGLGKKLDRFANKLSGGEQQRVAIARALINSPSIILADEPTGNLDTANSEIVFNLLQTLSRKQNLAVLLVTHNNQLAKRCDKFITMNDGLILS